MEFMKIKGDGIIGTNLSDIISKKLRKETKYDLNAEIEEVIYKGGKERTSLKLTINIDINSKDWNSLLKKLTLKTLGL